MDNSLFIKNVFSAEVWYNNPSFPISPIYVVNAEFLKPSLQIGLKYKNKTLPYWQSFSPWKTLSIFDGWLYSCKLYLIIFVCMSINHEKISDDTAFWKYGPLIIIRYKKIWYWRKRKKQAYYIWCFSFSIYNNRRREILTI